MPSETPPPSSIPSVIPRPGDGVLIDISELIRGGVRLSQAECERVPLNPQTGVIRDIPIEEMWDQLEQLLKIPQKPSN